MSDEPQFHEAQSGGDPNAGGDPLAAGGASLLVLIQSLGLQAMVQLGERPNPATGQPEVDLAQAKYTIDLLQVLRDKTDGNLTYQEDHVLADLLYELRMKYVARAGAN